jgi:tripartite-type tricarboxylate transporter receptor subunit TctC
MWSIWKNRTPELRRLIAVGAAAALGLTAWGIGGASAASFYNGKRIEWLVPASPGGGTDFSVRMLAPFLKKHLPGNPVVQVFNEPAGSAILGMNTFVTRPADGTNIVMTSSSSLFPFLFGEKGVKYKVADLEPIAGFPLGGVVYLSGGSPHKTAQSLFNMPKQLVFGGESAVGGETTTLLAFKVLDLNIRGIMGYDGSDKARIALEQGEIDVAYDTAPSYLKGVLPLEKAGKVRPVFTFGFLQDGKLVRDPLLPNLPHVAELFQEKFGKAPSGPAWDAYQASFPVRFLLNKVVWVHKDTPDAAKQELRAAFASMLKDPEFIAQKERALGPYPVLLGNDLKAATQALAQTDPAAITWMKDWLTKDYGARF